MLGQKIKSHAERDAIHIAIAPVVAGQDLNPGEHVGLENNVAVTTNPIGIVDPFLTQTVKKGEQFYLLLYPETITSLRHEWSHLAFTSSEEKEQARLWLERFAYGADLDFDTVIQAAQDYIKYGDWYTQIDRESARDEMYQVGPQEFWKNYEIYTGQKVKDKDAAFFSCSC